MTEDDAAGDVASGTVLVVEDNRDVADLYTVWLAETHDVRTAYDGSEALELLDDAVDVVLLDRRMPGVSGDELLDEIRDRGVDARIAMVTAVDPDFDIADLPIDDYLPKPVDREELGDLVEELLLRAGSAVTERELLALLSRRRTLEAEKSELELSASDRYATLERRIERARERLDVDTSGHASKYRPRECPECALRWDLSVGDTVGFVELGSLVWQGPRCGNTVRDEGRR